MRIFYQKNSLMQVKNQDLVMFLHLAENTDNYLIFLIFSAIFVYLHPHTQLFIPEHSHQSPDKSEKFSVLCLLSQLRSRTVFLEIPDYPVRFYHFSHSTKSEFLFRNNPASPLFHRSFIIWLTIRMKDHPY